jgi:GT2 family glycosyltransferase
MSDVSVIIPCHNGRDFIGPAIQSVLAQTDPPRQIIVVDDGSTDDSAAVVAWYADQTSAAASGKVVLLQQPKSGVSKARNRGIEAAEGQYLAFLDADDLWLPEKTARQLELLARCPDAVGSFCQLFSFEKQLDDLGRPLWERMADDPDIIAILRAQTVIASGVVVRRSMLGAVRFNETTGHAEDTIFAADLRLAGRWRLLAEPLLARRRHASQVTRTSWHLIQNTQTRIQWVRAHRASIGPELADALETEFGLCLVSALEKRYWSRQTDDLAAMCRAVKELCPSVFARSILSRRRIYPRWVYRLRDAVLGSTPRP